MSMSGCPFASLIWLVPAPILRRCVFVLKDQRTTWILCNNTTSRATARWYWFMSLPQFVLVPLLGVMHQDTIMGMIFGARVTATLVASEIDKTFPYQRAMGFSHVATFGPLLGWLIARGFWSSAKPDRNDIKGTFLWLQMRLMAICLVMDVRDILFQLAGYPYPCYIREAAIHKKLNVKDPKALKTVTWWSRIVGP